MAKTKKQNNPAQEQEVVSQKPNDLIKIKSVAKHRINFSYQDDNKKPQSFNIDPNNIVYLPNTKGVKQSLEQYLKLNLLTKIS